MSSQPDGRDAQIIPEPLVNGDLNPDSALERAAADLWRADNPKQSVFDCDGETKAHYRRLALERRAKA
jgi:hypothetical protein